MKTLLTSWSLLTLLFFAAMGLHAQEVAPDEATVTSLVGKTEQSNVSAILTAANDPKLYYNPFSEKLYIEQTFHTTTRVSMKLVDGRGRTVYELKDKLVYPGLNKMVVSLLESLPGAYFVHITAGEQEYIRTWVRTP